MAGGHDWVRSGEQTWYCTRCFCRKAEQHRRGPGGVVKNLVYAPGGSDGPGHSSEFEPDCRDMREDVPYMLDAAEVHRMAEDDE